MAVKQEDGVAGCVGGGGAGAAARSWGCGAVGGRGVRGVGVSRGASSFAEGGGDAPSRASVKREAEWGRRDTSEVDMTALDRRPQEPVDWCVCMGMSTSTGESDGG